MAFMRASISDKPETWLITEDDDGEILTCLPDGDYESDLTEEDLAQIAETHGLDLYDVISEYSEVLRLANDNNNFTVRSGFTIRTGFRGWLSAPGYLDRTPAVIADSVAEVARELLDTYFDHPLDEMDDDELEDMEWLCDLSDRVIEAENIRRELNRRYEAE